MSPQVYSGIDDIDSGVESSVKTEIENLQRDIETVRGEPEKLKAWVKRFLSRVYEKHPEAKWTLDKNPDWVWTLSVYCDTNDPFLLEDEINPLDDAYESDYDLDFSLQAFCLQILTTEDLPEDEV